MNKRVTLIGVMYLLVLLFAGGCQLAKKSLIPVTGGDTAPAPAEVEAARNNTVDYLISSDRLENSPPRTDWQLDTAPHKEGEYHFSNGDWVMVIWSADAWEQNERVVLRNTATDAVWCGHVQPDGHVVDTSFLP